MAMEIIGGEVAAETNFAAASLAVLHSQVTAVPHGSLGSCCQLLPANGSWRFPFAWLSQLL